MAGHSAHRHSRQCAAVAALDTRNDADRGSRLRRGMEIRSRHHGAVELPDAPVRSPGHSGEHQLPGTAADAAASRVGARRGVAPRRGPRAGTHRPGRHRRHFALAGDAGFREDQRKLGPGVSAALAGQRQAGAVVLHATRRPTAMPAREVSRFALSSASPPPRRGAGSLQYYRPIPIFSVGCTVATMEIACRT